MNSFTLDLDGGKYTYRFNNGKQDALRHGEPWRDLCGDNLVYWLAVEVRSYREACGDLVIPGDAPPGVLADAVKALRGLYQIMSQDVMKQADGLVFQDYGLLNDSLGGAQDVLAALNPEPVSSR